ncbi:ATP-dependent Clp protease proteolytic subunit [Streptomyces sp. AHA2]|uniref:ATP-dependent Clp protease proteolytic subunit n=1 Tax=Streptomyces sp. AHA2 TaxID=3064526 RepID=UPI002FE0B53D
MTAIYDTTRRVFCDVVTVRPGRTGALASVLLEADTPGKRAVPPGARVVLRRSAPTEPVSGRAGDPAVRAEELSRARACGEEMPARHTGRSREQVGADPRAGNRPQHRGSGGVRPGGPVRAPPSGRAGRAGRE